MPDVLADDEKLLEEAEYLRGSDLAELKRAALILPRLASKLRERSAALRTWKQDIETLCRMALKTPPAEWGVLFSEILEIVHPDYEDDEDEEDEAAALSGEAVTDG